MDLGSDGFGHWLAGFIDGEGHFYITRTGGWIRCGLIVNIRDDDAPVLEEVCGRLGVGRVSPTGMNAARGNPQVRWEVSTKGGCLKLVEIFDTYPLRAKKARDYAIWRQAVLLWAQMSRGRGPELMPPIRALGDALVAGRAYKPTRIGS